jgi:hypothetical protein
MRFQTFLFQESFHHLQRAYLNSVPTLRDDAIDLYHQHLWELCTGDDVAVPFGWSLGAQLVVRSREWQEAFDQNRRLDEPRSSGFLLQIDRNLSDRVSEVFGIELWAHLALRRSVEKYKPECQGEWFDKGLLVRLKGPEVDGKNVALRS